MNVLGHFLVLHRLVRIVGPAHSSPPCSGAGLVHERVLCWVPPPQVTVHFVNLVHAVNPPSTERKKKECFSIFFYFQKKQVADFFYMCKDLISFIVSTMQKMRKNWKYWMKKKKNERFFRSTVKMGESNLSIIISLVFTCSISNFVRL